MNSILKIILVDNESDSRNVLKNIIQNQLPSFEVVAEANSTSQALHLIEQHKPDIIITDINLSGGNCFEMLDSILNSDVSVIITTIMNNYALKAYKYNTIDYLLKPVVFECFECALQKIKDRRNRELSRMFDYRKQMIDRSKAPLKLSIHSQNEIEFIDITSIVRMEAEGCYTHIFLNKGRKLTVSKSLGEYEDILFGDNFVRVHNSHIVNLNYIRKFIKKDGLILQMMDDFPVPIAVRRKCIFEDKIKMMTI